VPAGRRAAAGWGRIAERDGVAHLDGLIWVPAFGLTGATLGGHSRTTAPAEDVRRSGQNEAHLRKAQAFKILDGEARALNSRQSIAGTMAPTSEGRPDCGVEHLLRAPETRALAQDVFEEAQLAAGFQYAAAFPQGTGLARYRTEHQRVDDRVGIASTSLDSVGDVSALLPSSTADDARKTKVCGSAKLLKRWASSTRWVAIVISLMPPQQAAPLVREYRVGR
jgi:hypothetical protein